MALVDLEAEGFDLDFDIRYATDNNFTGKPLYKNPKCFLFEEAADKLQQAIDLAKLHKLRFKVFDAFRPLETQKAMWADYPDPSFISNPDTGSIPHCRGVAVDLTLIDALGKELDMGTGFDAFLPESHHGNTGISLQAQKNRYLLMGIMTTAGWDFYRNEWWHYQLFSPREYTVYTDKEAGTDML